MDFCGKLFDLGPTRVLVAYDPSETGREFIIGVSPTIGRIVTAADGLYDIAGSRWVSFGLEAAASLRPIVSRRSYRCAHFPSRARAQAFFERSGFDKSYDPYNLDPDGDGRPCESAVVEGRPIAALGSGARKKAGARSDAPAGAYNCRDFATTEDAKRFFDASGFGPNYDPYGLDADNNGIPCESTGNVVADSDQCPSGESWVAPYTRSNGSKVRGHCRKRR